MPAAPLLTSAQAVQLQPVAPVPAQQAPQAGAAAADEARRQRRQQLAQLEKAMEQHNLPKELIDDCACILTELPNHVAGVCRVITTAPTADACRATAAKVLRHLELLRVLEQAGVNAEDAVRCAQKHAQLAGSELEEDETSAGQMHMMVTAAWGGGGEGGAEAVRRRVRACLGFF